MTAAAFDTLKLARRLEAAGMATPQAVGVAEALAEAMVVDPATRTDLMKLEHDLRMEIKRVEAQLRNEIATLRGEMHAGFAAVKFDVLRWVVPLILAQMGLTLGLFVRLA